MENLAINRQPMPSSEAIYLIAPTLTNVELVKKDFARKGRPKYAAAHVFFIDACPDEVMTVSGQHTAGFLRWRSTEVQCKCYPILLLSATWHRHHLLLILPDTDITFCECCPSHIHPYLRELCYPAHRHIRVV